MHGEDPQDTYRKGGNENIMEKHETGKSKVHGENHTEQNRGGDPQRERGGLAPLVRIAKARKVW